MMLADRYGLALTTTSAAARDAYDTGAERLLTLYPGAIEAFEAAIEADPGFALAHAGKAQVSLREGNGAAVREAMAAAKAAAKGLTEREASHIAFFDLLTTGRVGPATEALRSHLEAWPRDALVLTPAASPNGLIGASGRLGQKREVAALLDSVAPAYDGDWWFLSHHAMSLSEAGRRDEARPLIERSLSDQPRNANAAHARAHVYYEDGDADGGRAFLAAWLADYPHHAFFHGHLSWHRALGELAAGDDAAARDLQRDAFGPEHHSGSAQQKVTDGTSFLWRSELAGWKRNAAAWRTLHDFAERALPGPGNALADTHMVMGAAATGDRDALSRRVAAIERLAAEGRYASVWFVPAMARGFTAFERGDFPAAIEAFAPCVKECERIGGSRAQLDLIEFTLLKACIEAGRTDDARQLLAGRRDGPSGVPVEGLASVH